MTQLPTQHPPRSVQNLVDLRALSQCLLRSLFRLCVYAMILIVLYTYQSGCVRMFMVMYECSYRFPVPFIGACHPAHPPRSNHGRRYRTLTPLCRIFFHQHSVSF